METTVKLFAGLREGRFEEQKAQLEDNSRVIDVIKKYDLPLEEVAICMVNGRNAEFGQILQNGDTVAFSPPVGGA